MIGVLALQGSFSEHVEILKRCGASAIEVRTVEELLRCDGLIIPGGESTTMACVANTSGILDALRQFVVEQHKPVWGTCAGLIFLAKSAEGAKRGGQELLQCMPIHASRNFFGSQIASFEQQLVSHDELLKFGPSSTYRAIFIRAPAILTASDEVTVLSEYTLSNEERSRSSKNAVIVAARYKNMLVTAFHPELTDDYRWHQLFLSMVGDRPADSRAPSVILKQSSACVNPPNNPASLPVFGSAHPCA